MIMGSQTQTSLLALSVADEMYQASLVAFTPIAAMALGEITVVSAPVSKKALKTTSVPPTAGFSATTYVKNVADLRDRLLMNLSDLLIALVIFFE